MVVSELRTKLERLELELTVAKALGDNMKRKYEAERDVNRHLRQKLMSLYDVEDEQDAGGCGK